MTNEPTQNPPSSEPKDATQSTMDKILSSPHIQEAIAQIPEIYKTINQSKIDLLKAQYEMQSKSSKMISSGLFLWTAFMVFLVIAPISILTWYGKLSGEATTFLYGTIVGAAFTLLRNFFPSS